MKTDVSGARLSDVVLRTTGGPRILNNVTLSIAPGEIVGIVGESGAGKSSLGLALLAYFQAGIVCSSGTLEVGDERFNLADPAMDGRTLRGRDVAYVPQEPGVSLNPSTRIGDAIARLRREHGLPAGDSVVSGLLDLVHLPATPDFRARYPHQLSGGQQQRLCLALGIACDPKIMVLDEITTGLDVVTQSAILAEVASLADSKSIGMAYVTHDLAVVANLAHRIAVMYAGEIVEVGTTRDILTRPRHPYTKALIEAAPSHDRPSIVKPLRGVAPDLGHRPEGCSFADRCDLADDLCRGAHPDLVELDAQHQVRCFHHSMVQPVEPATPRDLMAGAQSELPVLEVRRLVASHKTRAGRLTVARGISFEILPGECVALVGESGSGKTTIARSIVGLHRPDSGSVMLHGAEVPHRIRDRSLDERRQLQFIFQNPRASLNPHHRIGNILERPLSLLRGLRGPELQGKVEALLDEVRLPRATSLKFPRELSGGERQRVGIARALAADPAVLVCDEVTSALDVSVQAAVLELLRALSIERGLGVLMITHDLGVVASIAHRVLVLKQGEICETGPVGDVLSNPTHEYTQTLLAAAPRLER